MDTVQRMRRHTGANSSKRARIAGVELAYDDDGSGPAIVCLHAIGHGAADYRELSRQLRTKYRVIALDWPGQGSSDADDAAPGDIHYAEQLRAFIEELGLDAVVLIGNSVGGAAAIRYAAACPDRVRALIVANPGGLFMRPPGFSVFPRLMGRFFEAGARGAAWFPWVFSVYYKRMLVREPAAGQRQRIIAAAVELAPILASAWRSFGEPQSDVRELVPHVRCPVLVTWATLDPINPLWMNLRAIRRFRDVQLAKFRAGHSPFLETPDEFVATFDAFMARVLRSGRAPAAEPLAHDTPLMAMRLELA
jgi:4,5:9,10-diseco-3-hydroxy-5,9,17-trioxoandrosta-1(10),2-diene-4-oate hydrolase